MNKKELIDRVVKTFIETFIPAMLTAIAAADYTDLDTFPRVLAAITLSAVATGISAVWNGVVEPMLAVKKGTVEEVTDDDQSE